ncbi:MAG: glycosyltransferase [Bacteroidales bacterium]|nr:glycosyltransferase [Bacteroidales bacterium]
MKLSVITPSYNQGAFIEQTVRIVLDQGLEGLEYIVVDGGSADETLEILRRYEGQLIWSSGRDKGLADAVNKGIGMATGEIIGWLNSDDLYLPGTLQAVADYFQEHPECRWLFGKCRIINSDGQEKWKWITRYKNLGLKRFTYHKLLRENFISQPAVFFRKDLFEEAGALDLSLKYAMDYDLWLRFAGIAQPGFIDRELSAFRRHGSSKSETGFMDQFFEQYEVAKRYDPSLSDRLIHRFNISKIILSYRILGLFSRF